MSAPRTKPATLKELETYSQQRQKIAQQIFEKLTANLASIKDDKLAIAEVQKSYTELKVIQNELRKIRSDFFAANQIYQHNKDATVENIIRCDGAIGQWAAALRWIVKGNELAEKVERNDPEVAKFDKYDVEAAWDFQKLKRSDEATANVFHPVRVIEGTSLDGLSARLSARLYEVAEDAAMLRAVARANEEERKMQQAEKIAIELNNQAEIERKRSVIEDGNVLGAILKSITVMNTALDQAKIPAANEIKSCCERATNLVRQGREHIKEALSELSQAARLLNQPAKRVNLSFFRKKDSLITKSPILAVLDTLRTALPDKYKSHLSTSPTLPSSEKGVVHTIRRMLGRGG